MEIDAASHAFATLGHPDRLAVLRLLTRFAPQGARPTDIAQAMGLKQNTLSHHLSDLANAGLIRVERDGRSLFYSINMPALTELVRFLALDTLRSRADILSPPTDLQKEHPMRDTDFDVLFICSGNSARSIFGEVLMRDLGQGRFQAFSAGTRPSSELNPFALEVLRRNGHDIDGLRSKHVSEFQAPDAVRMDFVFTVCDTAAAEECPPWEGQPITGHWGLPDPVKAVGTDAERALVFAQTYAALRRRIAAFVALPFDSLNRISLQSQVDAISADIDTKV